MYRLTLVHGLKRSGNHAIVNWLHRQQRFVFRNNVVPVDPILAGEAEVPPARPFDAWLLDHEIALRGPLRGRLNYALVRRARLVASLEDLDPDYAPFTTRRETIGRLIIVRDPENLFASRLRKARRTALRAYPAEDGPVLRAARDLWKAHAHRFLACAPDDPADVGVYYDRWASDPDYRRQLCRRLGLAARALDLGAPARHGGGSSFTGRAGDTQPDPEATRRRADQLDPGERAVLAQVLDDPELQDLTRRVAEAAGAVRKEAAL